MNCTVCGRELPDNAKFCSHCGYAVLPTLEYEQMYTTGDTVYNHFEFPRKKNKFLRIPLVVSLFLLLSIGTTIIILLVSYSGVDNSSIDAVIESYFNSIADKDIDDLFDTMYPIVISAYEEQAYSKEEIYEQINLMTAYKNYNNSAIEFSDIKITYTEYEGDESLDEYNEYLSHYTNDPIHLSSIVHLTGTFNAKLSNSSGTTELNWNGTVVCADGDYYIVDMYIDD